MSTRWYRSLYWRIGLGFILFLGATLVAQTIVGAWIVSRAAATLPGRSPANFATLVASDLSEALATEPSLDIDKYVRQEYAHVAYPIVVVMRDGRVVNPSSFPEIDALVRFGRMQMQRADRGLGPREGRGPWWMAPEDGRRPASESGALRPEPGPGALPSMSGPRPAQPEAAPPPGPGAGGPRPRRGPELFARGPFAPARIVVAGKLVGVVVVPPRAPVLGLMRQLGPSLATAGLVLLAGVTTLAAFVIFNPARRRLRALEDATARLGSGDLSARAPLGGGDEIASLARSFNTMADELTARAERLEQEDRRRRQLLADVSHELGTPLTAIRGYVETLTMAEMSIDVPTRDRYLGIISDETTRLERIVADLLDLARLENAAASLNIGDVPVSRLFDRVIARHERVAADKRVRMTADIEPGAELVRADADRIEQAIQNLAANALRHTPLDGSIDLRARKASSGVALSVIDSGEGIAPEHLPHVFDRFYKADQARSSEATAGSGLGLSIVKAIAERHGGSVSVESRPGRTAFSVFLPSRRV